MDAAQLQASQEQCESLESKRASLANALHKLEAFQRNILNTLQASDQVTLFVALSKHCASGLPATWSTARALCYVQMLELLYVASSEPAGQTSKHTMTHLKPAWLMQAGEDAGAPPPATRGVRERSAQRDDRYAAPAPQHMQISFTVHLAMSAVRATEWLSTDCHTESTLPQQAVLEQLYGALLAYHHKHGMQGG